MSDEYLFCNYKNCNATLTKFTWVTRCSHVFCESHGNAHFLNEAPKIKCPACNESNMRETDIIKSNLDPHDMLLSCVKPEKVLEYVVNSSKLWSYQMRQKRKYSLSMLCDKYEKMASGTLSKLKSENSEMKKFVIEIEDKLRAVNDELNKTKKRLWKYKMAYNNVFSKNTSPPAQERPSLFSDMNSDELNNREVEDIFQFGKYGANVQQTLSP